VFAFWIAEHFDLVEDVLPRIRSCFVYSTPDAISLEQVEKAFSNSIVMADSSPAHAVFQIVLTKECGPINACEL